MCDRWDYLCTLNAFSANTEISHYYVHSMYIHDIVANKNPVIPHHRERRAPPTEQIGARNATGLGWEIELGGEGPAVTSSQRLHHRQKAPTFGLN